MNKVTSRQELLNRDKYDQLEIAVDHEQEEALNIDLENVAEGAIVVTAVKKHSLFEGALKPGDYLLTVNGTSFKNRHDLYAFADQQDPELKILIARLKIVTTAPTTGTPPKSSAVPVTGRDSSPPGKPSQEIIRVKSGEELKNQDQFVRIEVAVNRAQTENLNIDMENVAEGAVMVNKIKGNSPLENALQNGDYLLTVNGKSFKSREELIAFAQQQSDPMLKFMIARPRAVKTVPPSKETQSERLRPQKSNSKPEWLATSAVIKEEILRVTTAKELQNLGKFQRLDIAVNHDMDEMLNIDLENIAEGAVMVSGVKKESLFAEALRRGDYILTVNEKTFKAKENLLFFAQQQYPTLKLSVARPRMFTTHVAALPTTATEVEAVKSERETSAKATPLASSQQSLTESQKSEKSSGSTKSVTPKIPFKILASFSGKIISSEKQYFVAHISTTGAGKPLGLGVIPAPYDKTVVVVSSVNPNSLSAEIFKLGDRILTINQASITDVSTCKKAVLDASGDFVVFFERPQSGLTEYGFQKTPAPISAVPPPIKTPLKCSYVPPVPGIPEQTLGNPLSRYEPAPPDVQEILNKQIPILFAQFCNLSSSQRSTMVGKEKTSLKIDQDFTQEKIGSDYSASKQLRKVKK